MNKSNKSEIKAFPIEHKGVTVTVNPFMGENIMYTLQET